MHGTQNVLSHADSLVLRVESTSGQLNSDGCWRWVEGAITDRGISWWAALRHAGNWFACRETAR